MARKSAKRNVLYRLPTHKEITKMGRLQLYRLIDVLGIEEIVTSGYDDIDMVLEDIEEIEHLRCAVSEAIRTGTSLCKHLSMPQPEHIAKGASNYHREINYAGCVTYSYESLWEETDDELDGIIDKYNIAGDCDDRTHLGRICNIADYMGTTDTWESFKKKLNSRFKCYNGKGVSAYDILWVLFPKAQGASPKNKEDEFGVIEEMIAYRHYGWKDMVVEVSYNGIQLPLSLRTKGLRFLHTGRTARGTRPFSVDDDRYPTDCDEPFDEKRFKDAEKAQNRK